MSNIESVEFYPLSQSQEDPNWTFAGASYPTVDGCVVLIRTRDGVVGHGYSETATHMGYTNEGIRSALELLKPHIIGRDVCDIGPIMLDLDTALVGNAPAKAGFDTALHDAVAKLRSVPLNQLFGGRFRDRVVQTRILPIKTPAQTAEKARMLAGNNYKYLKVKLVGDASADMMRVAAVRDAVGSDVRLTLDANQSYSPKSAISLLNRMERYAIDLVEQPVHARDLDGLALVTRSVPMAVEADEAASSVKAILHLVSHQIVDSVSLKIGKLGGLRNTMLAAQICEAGGVRCRMGATFGPQLYVAHGLHLAAVLPHLDLPCELAEFEHIFDDPYEGLELSNGDLIVPTVTGTGVSVREGAALKAA